MDGTSLSMGKPRELTIINIRITAMSKATFNLNHKYKVGRLRSGSPL